MFLLGAAFLLLETRAVTQLSLLFGSTWIVNTSVFGGILAMVLAVLLVVGGGYYFFVVQAQAAVSAPAALTVINQPVDVDGNPGIAGQAPRHP